MNIGRVERITKDGPQVIYDAQSPIVPDDPEKSKWPEPLKEHAFHGPIGELVRKIDPHTESDPAAILTQSLVAFGNVIGRGAFFSVEADRHYGNLFVVQVGETAKGRKGTSWGHVRRVFQVVDPEWQSRILSGLSSGEGLIWAVHDPIEKQEPIREHRRIVDYQVVVDDPGISDKRALLIEAEFAAPLRMMERDGSVLSAVMRDAWDMGTLRTITKNSPATATGAHVSIIGHVTKAELLRYLTSTETGNGFANRFLWNCARRSKILPEGGRIESVDFSSIVDRLKDAVSFARSVGELRRDDAAREIWCVIYEKLSEGKPGLFGSVTSRAEAQVVRLSLLYALLDCSPLIREEHLCAALAVWDYCEASARFIFGTALSHPEADTILTALKESIDGLTRTEIAGLFGRHKSASEIDQALALVQGLGRAHRHSEKTGGRPIERWSILR